MKDIYCIYSHTPLTNEPFIFKGCADHQTAKEALINAIQVLHTHQILQLYSQITNCYFHPLGEKPRRHTLWYPKTIDDVKNYQKS